MFRDEVEGDSTQQLPGAGNPKKEHLEVFVPPGVAPVVACPSRNLPSVDRHVWQNAGVSGIQAGEERIDAQRRRADPGAAR